MNRIIILGRLTKDPEIRYTQGGKVVAGLTLAVNRPFKGKDGQQDADFIPVVLWGKTAETVGNYVHKGQRLLIEGRLQIRSYTAKDGIKRLASEVVGDHIEFIEKKENSGSHSNGDFTDFGTSVPYDENIPF